MHIDPKKFFTAFFIFLATLGGLGYYHFDREQKQVNHAINTSLERTVQAASLLVGDRYQDKVLEMSPSQTEEADTLNTLTTLARSENVNAIYTLVLDQNGKLRFTSSSAQDNQSKSGLVRFNDPFPTDPDIIKALKSNQKVWNSNEKLNQRRSLYIPRTTSGGHRYVIGVDMEMDTINKLSNAAAFNAIANALIIFLGVLPFLLIYRGALHGKADDLENEVIATAEELDEVSDILVNRVEEKTKELIAQSFEDTLTGLPNRHRFQYDVDRKHFSALMIINVQNFRELSAFFGSSVGNDLLRQMGHWLETLDLLPYRLSGDEFAVLFEEEHSSKELEEIGSRLVHRLSDHPFSIGEESVSLRISIGIDPGPEGISLVYADLALRHARENHLNVAVFNSEYQLNEAYKSNLSSIQMIHKALHAGRIICYYQPIVSTRSGEIEKYATLARMIDEQAQMIGPADFIKIAQKTRLYPQITQTVIAQACETFRNRNEEFSVNLSIRDMVDPHTVRFIEETLVQTGTAHRMIFEIVESEALENFKAAVSFIHRMKNLGVKIAVDNFGTGLSHLENIVKLEADYVKLGGSLIHAITTDPKEARLAEAIAEFAKKLNVKVIGVQVSDKEAYTQLHQIGVDYAQGNYTGKPASISL